MQNKSKELCVLGGIYFVVGYIVDQIRNLLNTSISNGFIELIVSSMNILSILLDVVFVVLFLMILFSNKIFCFCKFMHKYTRTAVYLYYIGYTGYILTIFNILLLNPMIFSSFDEKAKQYISWIIVSINIIGLFIALIMATKNVFFYRKVKAK